MSALDTGVCVREGVADAAIDGAGEIDPEFVLLRFWNMLPKTLLDPGRDSDCGCSACAILPGDACSVALGAFTCAASAAFFCSSAILRAASRSSQYCAGRVSTGNIVIVVREGYA